MAARFSYQLYSARNHPPIETILKQLADLGYVEVEGFRGVYSEPEKLRAELNHQGLTMPSGHFSIDMLETEKKKVIQIASTLGIKKAGLPLSGRRAQTKDSQGLEGFWQAPGYTFESLPCRRLFFRLAQP